MVYDKADEVIRELFESLLYRYQTRLETSIKNSNFIFDCIGLLYCKCHKINPNRGESFIYYPDLTKNKEVVINLVNNDEICVNFFWLFLSNNLQILQIALRTTKSN